MTLKEMVEPDHIRWFVLMWVGILLIWGVVSVAVASARENTHIIIIKKLVPVVNRGYVESEMKRGDSTLLV